MRCLLRVSYTCTCPPECLRNAATLGVVLTINIARDTQLLKYATTNISPADSSTYFFGNHLQAIVVANRTKIFFDYTCKIIEANVSVGVFGTLASAETSTLSLRLNDTSDTEISALVQHDTVFELFNSGAISIAIVDGDYVEFKIVNPVWVTNPTSVFYNWQLVIRRP